MADRNTIHKNTTLHLEQTQVPLNNGMRLRQLFAEWHLLLRTFAPEILQRAQTKLILERRDNCEMPPAVHFIRSVQFVPPKSMTVTEQTKADILCKVKR